MAIAVSLIARAYAALLRLLCDPQEQGASVTARRWTGTCLQWDCTDEEKCVRLVEILALNGRQSTVCAVQVCQVSGHASYDLEGQSHSMRIHGAAFIRLADWQGL